MLRRDFLIQLAASAGSAALGGLGGEMAAAQEARGDVPTPAKLDRISISTWSLHNYFRATRRPDFNLPGPLLALRDFPAVIVNKYNVHHLEFCAVHFESTESAELRAVKDALVQTHSEVVNLVLDIKEVGRHGTFSDANGQQRRAAVNAVNHWVDVAHALGAKSVRVSPGKVDFTNMAPLAESYEAVAVYAKARGIHVIVENVHTFGTEHPEQVVELIKLIGPVRIGALPDFANFPDAATRERGLKMLFPYAQNVCHAKGLEFDAKGDEQKFNFPQAMEIARKAHFQGVYSIEFDGPGDPYAGIRKTVNELLKYL